MIYTITLNPALDYYMNFSEKNIKTLIRAKETKIIPGGKGINASLLLTNLKVPNEAIVLTGKATGNMLLNILKDLGIKYKNIDIQNNTRINVKASLEKTYELSGNAVNKNKDASQEIYHYLKTKVNSGDVVMIMGTTMSGLDSNIIDKISKIVIKNNAQLVYDLQGADMLKYLKYRPLVIKPNTFELGNYFDKKIKSFQDIQTSANQLIKLGAQNVIVSQDKDGAYLFNKETIIQTKPLKIKLINSSGAGDSMISGFIYKFMKTNNYNDSINFANASGAGTASVESIADADVINNLYKKVTSKIIKEKNVK